MTPQARAGVAALLEPGESLAEASTWADEHRRELPKTAPWHYVDVPLDEPKYDAKFSGDDPKKGCVVDKINEFRLVIKDKTKTVEERRFALRFLIHCVEDMRMPMHVGDTEDKGGNNTQVRFFDTGTNTHRLWDSDMIEWKIPEARCLGRRARRARHPRGPHRGDEGNRRGLGHREPAGRPASLPSARDRPASKARRRSWPNPTSTRICRL